jgi:2-methylcitrate dehydratase
MGMHFKLGLYEHQSAGALHGLIKLIAENPDVVKGLENIRSIKVVAYEPAFGIIGDPAKRNPKTRQSADHSMVFIVSRKLLKAIKMGMAEISDIVKNEGIDGLWRSLILTPFDYGPEALHDGETRSLMGKIEFAHGGPEYDRRYPEGIPTSIIITTASGSVFDSGLVMFPAGHSRNDVADLDAILRNKFEVLGEIATGSKVEARKLINRLSNLTSKSASDIADLYNVPIHYRDALEPEDIPNSKL